MLNVVIIEDEVLTAKRLEKLLVDLRPEAVVIAKLQTAAESISWFLQNGMPDLIFMDIRLTDGTSFAIFSSVNITAPVIFTTAYDEYALEAFQVHGLGYLLKPIEKEKLRSCLERFERFRPSEMTASLLKALEQIDYRETAYRKRFLVSFRDAFKSIDVSDIAYFVSEFKATYLITHDGQKFPIEGTLEQLEAQLAPDDFLKISRQLVVSPKAIRKIHAYFNGRLKLELQPKLDEGIVISREKSHQLKSWLNR